MAQPVLPSNSAGNNPHADTGIGRERPLTADPPFPKSGEVVNIVKDPPCLICGRDLSGSEEGEELGDPVKQEVDIPEGVEDEDLDFSRNINDPPSPSKEDPPSNLCSSSSPSSREPHKWSEEEKILYRWFQTWFKVNLTGKKKKSAANWGWSGTSGKDTFPFCGGCQRQLRTLLEFQRSLEALEVQIKNGIEDLREKINSCEEVFGRKGVYGADGRYRRARRQMVKDFQKLYPNKPAPAAPEPVQRTGTRLSGRKRTAPSRFSPAAAGTSGDLTGPIVLMSSADKTTAEEHLLNLDVKPDISDDQYLPAEDVENRSEVEEVDNAGWDSEKEASGTPPRRRRGGRRKRKRPVIIEPDSPPFLFEDDSPDDAGDWENLEEEKGKRRKGGDEDYRPEEKPPSKRRGRRPKVKVTAEEDDQDWVMEEDPGQQEGVEEEEEEDFSDHDEDGKYGRCKVDPEKRTLTYKSLVFHHLEPFTEKLYQCSVCNAEVVFSGSTRIRSHYLRFHTNKHSCKLCDHRAASASQLRDHVRVTHEGQRWRSAVKKECRICGKPVNRGHLKTHEWTHKNEEERRDAIARKDPDVPAVTVKGKKYQCDECGSKFSGPADLKRHQMVIHGSEEVRNSLKELCPECGGRFFELKQHRKVVHGVDGKLYTCMEPGCGRICKTLPQLSKHKNAVHRKIRPHKCNLCPRAFSNPKSLQNHLNLHNGIRPFQCAHCPSAFATKSMVKRHTDIYHTEGRPPPKRKPFFRGPTMLGSDTRKTDLQNKGQYLPPSALATWAAGREPTSHFPLGSNAAANATENEKPPPIV